MADDEAFDFASLRERSKDEKQKVDPSTTEPSSDGDHMSSVELFSQPSQGRGDFKIDIVESPGESDDDAKIRGAFQSTNRNGQNVAGENKKVRFESESDSSGIPPFPSAKDNESQSSEEDIAYERRALKPSSLSSSRSNNSNSNQKSSNISHDTASLRSNDGELSPDSPYAVDDDESAVAPSRHNFDLFQTPVKKKKKVAQMLRKLIHLNSVVTEENIEEEKESRNKPALLQRQSGYKMETTTGVYFPTIQNIFGIILFLRLTWVIGTAGVGEAFLIVFTCCLTTFLTAMSMSAIATNGVVPAGGSYFMISRTLGPEFGGAAGILFYLGNTFAISNYCLGAVELLQTYMAPDLAGFGKDDDPDESNAMNSMRLYASFILIVLSVAVFYGGNKYMNMFGNLCLFLVILAILCIYIGAFASPFDGQPQLCLVDGVLMKANYPGNCTVADSLRFPSWQTENSTYEIVPGIPGLGSGMIHANTPSHYLPANSISEYKKANPYQVAYDITTSFTVILAIFFPGVTEILAGSNRSGDLKDASRSIPRGTLAAISTTTVVYITLIFFLGGAVRNELLRDKYGDSIGGKLIVAEVAWPSPWVVLVGAFISSVGVGLQTLIGVPRLLQAIAKDNLIPALNIFRKVNKDGEPVFALIATIIIAEGGILIARVDHVAPIITVCFLLCYGCVNLACSLQALLRFPNWRPRFKYYHWVLSVLGVLLCLVLMFISSWIYSFVTIFIAAMIYQYIEFKGAAKEWGDGLRGLSMQAARYSLLRLEDTNPHTKNWRPQILVLCKFTDLNEVSDLPLLHFSGLLKGGKGLLVVSSIIEGDYTKMERIAHSAKKAIKYELKKVDVLGFAQPIVSRSVQEGMSYIIQGAGLGALKHNTVLIGWPDNWKTKGTEDIFVDAIRLASARHLAILVPKNISDYPQGKEEVEGTIDVWWVVNDGGMLILLAFLLQQDKIWRKCKLRVFVIAESDDNSIQLERDLHTFLYHLRIEAEAIVVELLDSSIPTSTYARTIAMEERRDFIQQFDFSRKEELTLSDNLFESKRHASSPRRSPNDQGSARSSPFASAEAEEYNLKRMNTAVKLNKLMKEKSLEAKLIMINLPCVPDSPSENRHYTQHLEVLSEGLPRVLFVRGGGHEVVTIFS